MTVTFGLQATVDVISSSSWLAPALAAMEMSQMVAQAMWERDSVLMQIPHVSKDVAQRAAAHDPPIDTIFDLVELEVRSPALLQGCGHIT